MTHAQDSAERQPNERLSAASTNGPSAWVAAIAIAIAVIAVYGRALDVPFIFDDSTAIVENPSIVSLWPLAGTAEQPGPLRPASNLPTAARPLVNLSFAVNYKLGGLNPRGYHAVNVLIHILTACLLWAIVRRTLQLSCFDGRFATASGWLALAAALLWALHPLQTEAVIYATQRTELMMAFFYLATLYCSLRYWDAANDPDDRKRTYWLLLATLACLCGMASKEVMVSAPLVVLLFERTFIAGSLVGALRRSRPLYLGLALTWIVLLALNVAAPRGASAGFHLGFSAVSWWLTQCKVLLMYLKLTVWPSPLLLHYEFPYLNTFGEAWMYAVPVVALVILTFALLVRNKPTGFLLASAAAVLAPTFFVPILTEMAAERRMYLPLAALVVLFVMGGWWLAQVAATRKAPDQSAVLAGTSRLLIPLSVALLILVCGAASAARLNDYYDAGTLWQQVAQHQHYNHMAHYNLGMIYNAAGREAESLAELQAAVDAKPDYPPALSALGFALIHAGRHAEAAQALGTALTIEPDYVPALNNLGIALIETGHAAEAIDVLQNAVRIQPKNAAALGTLGRALINTGRPGDAVEVLQASVSIAPNDPETLSDLAMALGAQNRLPEAIERLQRALELQPNFPEARNNLGIALAQTGHHQQAIEQFRTALRLKPAMLQVYANLAEALTASGQPGEATQVAQQGIAAARAADNAPAVAQLEDWLRQHPQPNNPPQPTVPRCGNPHSAARTLP